MIEDKRAARALALHARGISAGEIAAKLQVKWTVVQRWLEAAPPPPAAPIIVAPPPPPPAPAIVPAAPRPMQWPPTPIVKFQDDTAHWPEPTRPELAPIKPPIAESTFIKAPTKSQLMAGR